MFTRAGFNPHHTVVRHAKVALLTQRGCGLAYEARLIRFEPSGDLAWYSREGNFFVWAERAIEAPA